VRHKIGVKTIHTHSNQTKPDKTGSRAASTAQFAALLIAWRKRNELTRAAAARQLRCAPRKIPYDLGGIRRLQAARLAPV